MMLVSLHWCFFFFLHCVTILFVLMMLVFSCWCCYSYIVLFFYVGVVILVLLILFFSHWCYCSYCINVIFLALVMLLKSLVVFVKDKGPSNLNNMIVALKIVVKL